MTLHDQPLPPHLSIEGMSKRFGSLAALTDVSLDLAPGSFHALLGENGAGKSTLVKCLMGYYQPDTGRVCLDGVERSIRTPRDAHFLGIGMVYQHFTLVPNMTVEENLLLARSDIPGIIGWRDERERMRAFLRDIPFRVDLTPLCGALAAGVKQKVEIVKQLYVGARILILDEPTSVLTPDEADQILGLLRQMTLERKLSVVFISHKLREVLDYAEEVTVLRLGHNCGGGKIKGLSREELTRMMVGAHEFPTPAKRSPIVGDRPIRLQVSDLRANNDKGVTALDGVSFSIRAGEILGIAGVSGNGQLELVQVLAGQRTSSGGSVRVNGKPYSGRRKQITENRVHCLPEEPLANACVGRMNVAENLAFRLFDAPDFTRGRWFIKWAGIENNATKLISQFGIKANNPAVRVDTLSGGNVQRLVLARELSESVEVLIVANPCFGLDVKAIAEIRRQVMEARNRGAAVLLVSEDLDEIFELADRIIVMFNGKMVYEVDAIGATRDVIGQAMTGHVGGEAPSLAAAEQG